MTQNELKGSPTVNRGLFAHRIVNQIRRFINQNNPQFVNQIRRLVDQWMGK